MISRPISSARLPSTPWHLHANSSIVALRRDILTCCLDESSNHVAVRRRIMSSWHRMSLPSLPPPIPTDSFRHSNKFAPRLSFQTASRPLPANGQNIQTRQLSSTASSKSSLRKLIRPFLLACHPDAMSSSADNHVPPHNKRTSQTAKEVNLKAVQIINGLIDTCDDYIDRCCTPSRAAETALPEFQERYSVEFLLPGPENEPRDDLRVKPRRPRRAGGLTMRSVILEFPTELREEVRRWARRRAGTREDDDEGVRDEAVRAGRKLKRHAERELRRLLTVAGLEYGPSEEEEEWRVGEDGNFFGERKKGEEEWTLSDHFLYELGIEPTVDVAPESGRTSAFYGRHSGGARRQEAPPAYSHVHQQREAFLKSIRWDKFRDKYDKAWEDAQAHFATSRMKLFNVNTKEGRERRERFVSMICGRVRIWMGDSPQEDDAEEWGDDIPEGLDVVQQLVAIRRLSSTLYDNFDYLRMEKMGRMWENLVIVFTPPRSGRRRQQTLIQQDLHGDGVNFRDEIVDVDRRQHSPHPGRKLNKWERRMKRRERTAPQSRGIMRKIAESHFRSLNKTQYHHYSNHHDTQESNCAESDQNQSTTYSSQAQTFKSGFKFSYGTQSDQGTGQVTAYVPIDFKEDELVQKLHTYLYAYFDNCYSDAGFFSFGPDGEVTANVDGLEEEEGEEMKVAN